MGTNFDAFESMILQDDELLVLNGGKSNTPVDKPITCGVACGLGCGGNCGQGCMGC